MAVFLTPEGYEWLREEWEKLTQVRRPQILADLKQAREDGDLRENAAYDTARLEQSRTEGRIRELEEILKSARLIRWTEPPTRVDLGVQVTLLNLATEETVEYTVVTGEEVAAGTGRISINSPLGQALAGRRVGSRISLSDRPVRFRILDLRAADGTAREDHTPGT
jgi:transcription elongation factor GreA